MNYKSYAGIGSRSTPKDILRLMEDIGQDLARQGWTLRSGGAPGADTAFEKGALAGMDLLLLEPWPEIFLPWLGFNERPIASDYTDPTDAAFDLAGKFHPNWQYLKYGAKKLHARNSHQVLGANLDSPASFVICWTKDGKRSGGTGQALRIAEAFNIPIYDLALVTKEELWDFIL